MKCNYRTLFLFFFIFSYTELNCSIDNPTTSLTTLSTKELENWFKNIKEIIRQYWYSQHPWHLRINRNKNITYYDYSILMLQDTKIKYIEIDYSVKGIFVDYTANELIALSADQPGLYTIVSAVDFEKWNLTDRMRFINYLIRYKNSPHMLDTFFIRCSALLRGTAWGSLVGYCLSPLLLNRLEKKFPRIMNSLSKTKKTLLYTFLYCSTTLVGCLIGQQIEHMYLFKNTQI